MSGEVLSCSGLTVRVGGRVLAQDVTMTVGAGEFHVLTGRSGTGKSTLLWTVSGLLRAGGGAITICGEKVDARRVAAAAAVRRRHLGIVYQQPNLLADLTVVENIAVPLMLTAGASRLESEGRAESLVRSLGINPLTPTQALSGGEQQRVAVARALAGRPELVLADEPTASLDPESGAVVMDALEGLCREQGTGLLVASHDPAVVARATYRWVLADEVVRGPWARRARPAVG